MSEVVDPSTPEVTNVIASIAARALVDAWLHLRHEPASSYGQKLTEIAEFEEA